MKGKIFVASALMAAAVLVSGPANAGCSPTKEFDLSLINANYWLYFPVGADKDPAAVIGRFWAAGNFAGTNNTTSGPSGLSCPDDTFVRDFGDFFAISGSHGGDAGAGPCDPAGCPTGNLIILVQTKSTDGTKAYYSVGRISETPQPAWDFTRTGSDWNIIEIPRPKVILPSAGTATFNVVVAPPEANSATAVFHSATDDNFLPTGTITAYQLVTFTGVADPGRAAGSWTNAPAGGLVVTTNPAVTGLALPCPAGQHVYLANRPVFDNGQFAGDYVSASVDIRDRKSVV